VTHQPDDDDSPRSLAIAEAIGAYVGTLSGHGVDFHMDAILKKALEACAATGYDRAVAEVARIRAERDRFREHSTTLNTVAFAMALALGDVAPGADETAGNPIEQTRRLINVYSPNWLGRANTASALAHLDAHAADHNPQAVTRG